MRKYSKGVVLLVIALNVAFVLAVLFVNFSGHDVPDSLVYSWFAFTTGELLALAGITITDKRTGSNMFSEWFSGHFGDVGKSTDNESKETDDGFEEEVG